MLDFYRRPLLTGSNLRHLPFATVRGNVRRNDADITSAQPYYPSAGAAQTLTVVIDGVTYNVSLSGKTFAGILADINAVITTNGTAFDGGGVIAIESATQGGLGSVSITAGTAAPNIGFDLSYGPLTSVGGDLFSSPEGGLGNPLGTSSPGAGENLSIDAINRITGRMMANADILYADVSKNNPFMKSLGAVTSTVISGQPAYGYVTLGSTVPVFNGVGGLLSRTSTPEELSAFFEIIDSATNQPCMSKVVAAVQGTPTTAPPYSNTAGYGVNDGLNILGLDLVKSSSSISAIANGRKVTCSGSVFTSAVVGDLVEITGATNTSEWNNNGLKWVIEQILDTSNAVVRPMSNAEAAALSVTLTDNQPVVELSSKLNNSESYGTLRVHTGFFTTAVTLVVSPPLPSGGTYTLWMSQPFSTRSAPPGQHQYGSSTVYRSLVSTQSPTPDTIISGLVPSNGTHVISLTSGAVRWHGKQYSIPATTLDATTSGISSDGTYYIYFDSATGIFKATATASNVFGAAPLGPYVCTASKTSGPTSLQVLSGSRPGFNGHRKEVTVGPGGDFADLPSAVDFANREALAYSETTSSNGAYAHYDIVVLSDQTLTSTLSISAPGVTIRAVNETISITQTGSAGMAVFSLASTGGVFRLEAVQLVYNNGPTDNAGPIIDLQSGAQTDIVMRRVTSGSDFSSIINQSTGGQNAGNIVIEDSALTTFNTAINASAASVYIDNSSIFCDYQSFSTTQVFGGSGGVSWNGGNIACFRSHFNEFGNPNDVYGVVVQDSGSSNIHVFEDCTFNGYTFELAHGSLFATSCETHIVHCSGSTTFSVANLSHAKSTVEFSAFTGSASDVIITVPLIRGSTVTCSDTSTSSTSAVNCAIADGNYISGTAAWAIDLQVSIPSSGGVRAVNNILYMSKGSLNASSGIRCNKNFGTIAHNYITLGAGYTSRGSGILEESASLGEFVALGNTVILTGPNCTGIGFTSTDGPGTVQGNIILSQGTGGSGNATIGLDLATSSAITVTGNYISLLSTDSNSAAVSQALCGNCIISSNFISSSGGSSLCVFATSSSTNNMLWTGNILGGAVGTSGTPIGGRFTNNRITGAAFIKGVSGTTAISVSSNRFESGVTLSEDSGVTIDFCDNIVLANTTIPAGGVQGSNNYISGDLTFADSNLSTWVGGIVTGTFTSGNSPGLQVLGTDLNGSSKTHTINAAVAIGISVASSSTVNAIGGARISSSVLGILTGGGYRVTDCKVAGNISITVADANNDTILDIVDCGGILSASSMSGRSLMVRKNIYGGISGGVTANVRFDAVEHFEISDCRFRGGGTVSLQNLVSYTVLQQTSRTFVNRNRIPGTDLKVNSTAQECYVEGNEIGSDAVPQANVKIGNLTIGYDPGGGVQPVRGILHCSRNILRYGGTLQIIGDEAATGTFNTLPPYYTNQPGTIAYVSENISQVEADTDIGVIGIAAHLHGAPRLDLQFIGRGRVVGNNFNNFACAYYSSPIGGQIATSPDSPMVTLVGCNMLQVRDNIFMRQAPSGGTTNVMNLTWSNWCTIGANYIRDQGAEDLMHGTTIGQTSCAYNVVYKDAVGPDQGAY